MEFDIYVKRAGDIDDDAWLEHYDKPIKDPKSWARRLIKKFNETLRPWERPRELVKVVIS